MRNFLIAAALLLAAPTRADDLSRWRTQAAQVTITRDDWGIAHIRGKTDADAVFGMIYAQAEDDFNRVETNYLTSLGRTAEAEGEAAIWADLRQKLYVQPADLKVKYAASPRWLQALMDAWADGLNFYLATHPKVTPRVITRFEPWMALSFTEGSIGGDIERINLDELRAFYGGVRTAALINPEKPIDPTGSNGIAIAPKNTKDGRALLLINPHTSFFFRAEQQVTSDDGLNAYGAATWGQFFVYQGFNASAGWMHTSSGVDSVDEFAEDIVRGGGKLSYRYGAALRPVTSSVIVVPYKTANGMAERRFTVFRTHHGPVVREAGGKWIAFAMMDKPIEALQQSFLRTKASDYASFAKVAALKANSSNNTLFADAKGEIAYLHPQFVPVRDDRFDYTKPVDGSDPATDWRGLHPQGETPTAIAPGVGWVMNTNNWPYSAAGPDSPKRASFPRYMDMFGETPRGVHAAMLLKDRHDFTPQRLMEAAYDSYQPGFAALIPTLVAAYDAAPVAALAEPIEALRKWDYRWGIESVPTTLAMTWGEELRGRTAKDAEAAGVTAYEYMPTRATPAVKLAALASAVDRLQADFGSWRTPWGEINRFQRLNGDITQRFTDDGPSIPVGFTHGNWGSLASFAAKRYPGTKRLYGTSGNSFVAVVEFGPTVRAVAITAGGESGDPASKHFNDQARRYSTGTLREVYFDPAQLIGHTERVYRPGE